MKLRSIEPLSVEFVPDNLDDGIIYISEKYKTASHKCCCGCGEEVVTPLSPADWTIKKERNLVSLTPSIGNWSFKCKSHYWIIRNNVIWAGRFSKEQIHQARERDATDKKAYIAAVNTQKKKQSGLWSFVTRALESFMRWIRK